MIATMAASDKTRSRDLTLDLLRGYFLFVIIIDHLQSFPSIFEIFTAQGGLWVTAAEGFFFVSGLLVGRLRLAEAKKSFSLARRKLLKRAWQLYLASILLTLFFTIAGYFFHYTPQITLGISHDPIWLMAIKILTLQYSYGLADMLPLYTIYLLFSIPALWLVLRGRAWVVGLISLSVWTIGFMMPEPVRLSKLFFSDISWQVLFFSGFLVGCYFDQIKLRWCAVALRAQRRIVLSLGIVLAICALISLGIFYRGLIPGYLRPAESFLFDKLQLGPGRLVVSYIFIAFAYIVIRHHEGQVIKKVGWFLLPLGQNSLYVYIMQSLIIFVPFGNPIKNNFWLASLEGAATVFVIWWLTKKKVLFSIIPR